MEKNLQKCKGISVAEQTRSRPLEDRPGSITNEQLKEVVSRLGRVLTSRGVASSASRADFRVDRMRRKPSGKPECVIRRERREAGEAGKVHAVLSGPSKRPW